MFGPVVVHTFFLKERAQTCKASCTNKYVERLLLMCTGGAQTHMALYTNKYVEPCGCILIFTGGAQSCMALCALITVLFHVIVYSFLKGKRKLARNAMHSCPVPEQLECGHVT
jgi:hypothetical protein